jgi:integrase
VFGQKTLNEISVLDVNRWTSDQLRHSAPATVKRQLNTFKAILNDAKRTGLLERNPCEFADKVRGDVPRQRFLDGTEIVTLLAKAQELANWLPDVIVFAIHSGMRKGEFRNLKWQDVRVIDDTHTVVLIPNSKSGLPRSVPCTKTMKEILVRQNGRKVAGDDRVFPISAMTLRRKWEKARKEAGLEDVNIHDLRRTHGTHAAAAGVDLRTLAARIGHTDLTMLEKHYAALVGSAATEAAQTFERRYEQLIAGR